VALVPNVLPEASRVMEWRKGTGGGLEAPTMLGYRPCIVDEPLEDLDDDVVLFAGGHRTVQLRRAGRGTHRVIEKQLEERCVHPVLYVPHAAGGRSWPHGCLRGAFAWADAHLIPHDMYVGRDYPHLRCNCAA